MRPLGTEKTTLHSINIQQGWEKNDLHARLIQVRLCHKIFQSHLVKPYFRIKKLINHGWQDRDCTVEHKKMYHYDHSDGLS